MNYLIYSFIILCSLAFFPGIPDLFKSPKQVVFILGSLVIFGYSLSLTPKRVFKNIFVSLAVIFLGASFTYYTMIPLVVPKDGLMIINVWNLTPSLCFFLSVLLLKTIIEHTDQDFWEIIPKILCWISFLLSIYSIYQYFGYDQIFQKYIEVPENFKTVNGVVPPHYKMVSLMGNPFLTSKYIAIVSPLFLLGSLRYKLMYPVCFFAVILCNTVVSTVAMMAGLLLFISRYGRVPLISAVLILGSIAYSVFMLKFKGSLSLDGRIGFWYILFMDAHKNFLTGTGLGSILNHQYFIGGELLKEAHNEFLQAYREGGLVLLSISLGYLVSLFRRIKSSNVFVPSLVAFLIVCLGGFPLQFGATLLLGILIVGGLEYA